MRQGAEDFMIQFQEYVKEENIEMTEKNRNEELQKFIGIYNQRLQQKRENAVELSDREKAEDYYEMAMESNDFVYCKRMLKKAIKLNPGFIDAHAGLTEYIESDEKRLQEYRKIEKMAWKQLEDLELTGEENKKHFYGIIETRPYMRLKHRIMQEYKELGCITLAIQEGEEIIRLNENDNLGVRYDLMAMYTMLEEKEKAEALYEQYQEDSVPMHLFLAILNFKFQNMKESKEHLKKIKKLVPNAKYIFDPARVEEVLKSKDGYYRPYSLEEILLFVERNSELFTDSVCELMEKAWV